MIAVDDYLCSAGPPAAMVLQVHDELVFEARREVVGELGEQVRSIMSAAADLRVPLLVDIGVGANWDEAH